MKYISNDNVCMYNCINAIKMICHAIVVVLIIEHSENNKFMFEFKIHITKNLQLYYWARTYAYNIEFVCLGIKIPLKFLDICVIK